jgi:hypothetical protein
MAGLRRFILDWKIPLASGFIVLSAGLYALHYLLFRDAYHLFYYLLSDLAFIPINMLIVTFIISRLLESREKKAKLKKLNMVIGAFYTEVGSTLISMCCAYDPNIEKLREILVPGDSFSTDKQGILKRLGTLDFAIDPKPEAFRNLKNFLVEKYPFLLSLLENPNLLEHDSFTDLLWAVFHLTEELVHRKDLWSCGEKDLAHLRGDVTRAYSKIVDEWVTYMFHLKTDYPYLYSLAFRLNPFLPEPKAEISENRS